MQKKSQCVSAKKMVALLEYDATERGEKNGKRIASRKTYVKKEKRINIGGQINCYY